MFKKIFGICVSILLIATNSYGFSPSNSTEAKVSAMASSACVPAIHPLAYQPGFRAYFEKTARCTCKERGLPAAYCDYVSMETLYSYMINIYHTLPNACSKQTDVPPQECIDDWNCFRLGGRDSSGRACSKTMA